jgi:hypothetical protein
MRLFLICCALVACGSSTTKPAPDASTDTGATANREPKVHRASASPCDTTRPPTTPPGFPNMVCQMDSDCTMGKNGRCVSLRTGEASCTYDACTMDTDCGSASVCTCREPTNAYANTCERGNCVTDADCGGKYCSPSGFTITVDCRDGIAQGSFGWFCHTAKDDCTDDSDCADDSGMDPTVCLFDSAQTKWVCKKTHCLL